MRIYIGIFPDTSKLPLLDRVYDELTGFEDHVQFTPREQLHFSLAFLGDDISSGQVQKINSDLQSVLANLKPFEYQLTHLSLNFPMHVEPEWVMYFIKKTENLQRLYLETIRICREAGAVPITSYDFLPHITIGKIVSPLPNDITAKLYNIHDEFITQTAFTATEVRVVESTIIENLSVYNPLATIQLGG